jgi:hypothetical protein
METTLHRTLLSPLVRSVGVQDRDRALQDGLKGPPTTSLGLEFPREARGFGI